MGWQPIETAPKDGKPFEALYDDGTTETDVYWSPERYCIIGAPQGSKGPGCMSTEAGLPVDPTHWRAALATPAPAPAPASAPVEFDHADAAKACRETAAELRANSNGNCNAVEQALHWERKAKEHDAPAPAPADAAGLVAEMLAACDKLDQVFDPAFTVLWRKAASALAAAAEREHLLQAKLERAKDNLARCCEERAAAAEREAALVEKLEAEGQERKDAELGLIALMWLPGVRAALNKLPPGDKLAAHMERLDQLLAAEARVTAAEAERDRLKAVIRALQGGLVDQPPLTAHAEYTPITFGAAAIRKETT